MLTRSANAQHDRLFLKPRIACVDAQKVSSRGVDKICRDYPPARVMTVCYYLDEVVNIG